MFIGDILSERARVTPDRVALISAETGERLTYREFDLRAAHAGRSLRACGLSSGDRFGLLAYNSISFLEIFFGAIRSGIIVVPLSTRATAHELQQIVTDCGIRVLFNGAEFESIAQTLGVSQILSVDWRRDEANASDPEAERDPEAIACLLYTSGTTGKPKGVMIPRRQLWWNGYNTAVNWGLREDDVSSIFTPLYHAGGFAVFLIPLFSVGGTIVVHKSFDPAQVWKTIANERCTVVLGVPTIWKMLMEDASFADADLSSIRWLISGGAPLPTYIIDAYQRRGMAFKQGYGMTEVGVNCFTMTVEESFAKPGSIGHPMMFTEVILVNETGEPVQPGEVGEMWIRGPHVSKGYWGNDDATKESYASDGWFKTGDLAKQDPDGFFYIAGRRKEMFITGGVNVYPAEIEAELVAHPAVEDAAVIAIADDKWGEVGVSFVVAPQVSAGELADYLSTRISRHKIPTRFVFLEVLPRSAYGKVLKEELRSRLAAESEV